MVECPRCGKKVPDNMKFCGFCGIELETGKKATTDTWIAYLQTYLSRVQTDMLSNGERMIAALTLVIASIVTTFTNIFSLNSPVSLSLSILGVVGIIFGLSLVCVIVITTRGNGALGFIYTRAYVMAATGELSTSKDFVGFLERARNAFRKELALAMSAMGDYRGRLSGESEPENTQT